MKRYYIVNIYLMYDITLKIDYIFISNLAISLHSPTRRHDIHVISRHVTHFDHA